MRGEGKARRWIYRTISRGGQFLLKTNEAERRDLLISAADVPNVYQREVREEAMFFPLAYPGCYRLARRIIEAEAWGWDVDNDRQLGEAA